MVRNVLYSERVISVSLSCEKPSQKLQAPQPAALSAMQACKAVRKGSGAMWLLVTESDESDQSRSVHVAAASMSESPQQQPSSHTVPDSELQNILHEYQDCFPESLPEGLPVEQDVAHTIPTQVGAAPPTSLFIGSVLLRTLKFSTRFQMDSGGASLSPARRHMGRLCSLLRRRMAVCACALTTEH